MSVLPLIASVLLTLPLGAGDPVSDRRAISLAEAIALADEHDARFETLSFDEQEAMWNAAASAAQLLPAFSAQAAITRNAREVKIGTPPDERVVSPLYVPQASASARLALFRGPDLPAAFAAWQRYGATQLEAAEGRDALRGDVAALYLSVAELDRVLSAQRAAGAQAEALVAIAAARIAAGTGLPLELADAEAEHLRIQAEEATTSGELEATLLLLKLRLGVEDTIEIVVACDACVEVPPQERAAELMATRRGDLLSLDKRAWAARTDEVAGWASLLPVVEVVGNARLQQPTLFSPDPVWWTAQLVLRWDILGPSPRTGGVLRSMALDRVAARSRHVHSIALAEARVAVRAARARWSAIEQGFLASRARSSSAQAALVQAEARFKAGRLSSGDVLDVARRKAEADRDLARADFARLNARLTLRRTLGLGPLDDGEPHG